MAGDTGFNHIATTAVEGVGQRVRARSGAQRAVANVALLGGDDGAPRLQSASQRKFLVGMLHQRVDQHRRHCFGTRVGRCGSAQHRFFNLTDTNDTGRAFRLRGCAVVRDRNAQRVVVGSVVRAFVGVGIGAAATVVVSRVLSHRIKLPNHVLVSQVKAQVAKLGGIATGGNGGTGAIGRHQFVGSIAVGRVRQEIFDRDAAGLVIGRVVEGNALDIHLVLGGVGLHLVEVHALRRNGGAHLVAIGAV